MHKAGYVHIIGNPNAGKSTLMNSLLGEQLSITSPKAQTTRHRILGILNEEDYQIIFSDTPGIVHPHYKLQQTMLDVIQDSLQDADMFILISDNGEEFKNVELIEKILKSERPVLLLINKMDLSNQAQIAEKLAYWQEKHPKVDILPISALHKFNIDGILSWIVSHLPESDPYYPKDEISDRNVRFFVSEIIRAKILKHYQQEIPYSVEVYIEEYVENENIDRIRAIIYVERESQKIILIGKGGLALKRVGTEARRESERFLGKKVFLEMHVKVLDNWRDNEKVLKNFGYITGK